MEGRALLALHVCNAEALPSTDSARPAEVCDGEDGTPKSDARTHRTPKALRAKIHGKRLAVFREALGVRTRRRVAFNQDAA